MGYGGPIETAGAIRPSDPDADVAESRARWRHRLLFAFFLVLIAGGAAYGVHWFNNHVRYVSTDDAYVDAQVAQIAPQIDGSIAMVAVHDTQSVKRGDLLARLDPADAELAVEQARANYEQALRRVQQYTANANAAEASVAGRQSDLARAALDLRRRDSLARTGAVSGDEISTARNAFDNARSALAFAQQALAAQRAMVQGADVLQNPEVRAAKAALDKARLDLRRTEIRSPLDGIVAQNQAQIGQRVRTGMPLMSVVPVKDAYVNANFKEVQLERIHPGQAVALTSDLYGAGVVFHGRVVGVSGGTGAAFAVIPAQNATGNWIKVVQRLPVRIALDRRELAHKPLRMGLSMNVTVDLDPFVKARPRIPARPPAKTKENPSAKIALDRFSIDPALPVPAPVAVTPKAEFAQSTKPVQAAVPSRAAAQPADRRALGAQQPVLRTAVSY